LYRDCTCFLFSSCFKSSFYSVMYCIKVVFTRMFPLLNSLGLVGYLSILQTMLSYWQCKNACLWYRCCKFDLHGPDAEFWDDFDSKMMDCVRNTLDRRIQFYEEEIRRLSEQRFTPIWNFCNFFILKVNRCSCGDVC